MHALNLIGFTGTIASGKSVRCHHLLNYAATKYNLYRIECTQTEQAAQKLSSESSLASANEKLLSFLPKEKCSSTSKCNNLEWTELLHKTIKNENLPIKCTNMAILHINADTVAHDIYAPGEPCYYELIKTFGDRILCKEPLQEEEQKCEQSSSDFTTSSLEEKDVCDIENNEEEQELEYHHHYHYASLMEEERKPWERIQWKALPEINRHALGEIVFADQSALQTLNCICRPAIAHKVRQMIIDAYCTSLQHSSTKCQNSVRETEVEQTLKSERDEAVALIVLLEAALLIEAENFISACNEVWITYCDHDEAIARVMHRNHLSESEAKRRLQSQLDLEGKVARLQNLHYDKPLRLMNTSHINTAEGLRYAEELFNEFWRINVTPYLKGH